MRIRIVDITDEGVVYHRLSDEAFFHAYKESMKRCDKLGQLLEVRDDPYPIADIWIERHHAEELLRWLKGVLEKDGKLRKTKP